MSLSVNREKRAGRPAGRKTRWAGITAFCRSTGYAHQHVREVLEGRRRSARVRGLWAAWERKQTKGQAK